MIQSQSNVEDAIHVLSLNVPVADEHGLFEKLVLQEIYRKSNLIQQSVASFLVSSPKTAKNQIRLLKLYISTENLGGAIELYKVMFKEWRDRRQLKELERIELDRAEVGLKKLMILKQDKFGVMPTETRRSERPKRE